MATTQSISRTSALLDAGRTAFYQKLDQLRAHRARNKIYNTTVSELAALSDRDLSDLGIARSNIKRIAMEAANGSK